MCVSSQRWVCAPWQKATAGGKINIWLVGVFAALCESVCVNSCRYCGGGSGVRASQSIVSWYSWARSNDNSQLSQVIKFSSTVSLAPVQYRSQQAFYCQIVPMLVTKTWEFAQSLSLSLLLEIFRLLSHNTAACITHTRGARATFALVFKRLIFKHARNMTDSKFHKSALTKFRVLYLW